jgi:hypothetical protein
MDALRTRFGRRAILKGRSLGTASRARGGRPVKEATPRPK